MGRRAAAPRMDRRGHAEPSGLGQRLDGHMSLANTRRARGRRSHARHAGRRRRHDRARRARRADRHSQGQRRVAGRRAPCPAVARRRRIARSTPRCATSRRRASRRCITWGRGTTWRSSSARTTPGGSARAFTRRSRSTRGSACATPSPHAAVATSGFASARSRDSSTARSARTPPRCSSRSPTRRTTSVLFVNTPDDLYAWTSGADRAGLHMIVHAIGDRAIRTQLDIYRARRARERPARPSLPHRARAAPRTADDIPRFAALGVIASMQPYHAIDDGRWAERVIGAERAKMDVRVPVAARRQRARRVRERLVRRAAHAARGDLRRGDATDARRRPVRTAGIPEQRITVEEALRAYTRDAAYASFDETEPRHDRQSNACGFRNAGSRHHAHSAGRGP